MLPPALVIKIGRAVGVLAACWMSLGAAAAAATMADDLCLPSADPCRVSRTIAVTPDSIIDVGNRALVIADRGALVLASGRMTLRAASLTVEVGGRLDANGTASRAGAEIVATATDITIAGDVLARGSPPGLITLEATGAVQIGGAIDARSSTVEDGGGLVSISGGAITVAGRIEVNGGREDSGGEIGIDATGDLQIDGSLNASGGDGGGIDIAGTGSARIGPAGEVDADAVATAGSGGDIDLTVTGPLTIDGEITAVGRNGTTSDGGGDGGIISLGGSTVTGARAAARIAAPAGSPDGVGGDIDITADAGAFDYPGRLEAQSPGTDGDAGSIAVDAVGAALVRGALDASGGRGGGGEVDLSAGTDLEIASGASITAAASSSGAGGAITLTAANEVRVNGTVIADGGSAQGGIGGETSLQACTVRVNAGGRLSSVRAGGTNTLIGRDRSIVGGILRADPQSGFNAIRIAGAGYDPVLLGSADILPAVTVVTDASIVPCNPIDTPTPGPTSTQTRTASATPSATNTRPTATATDTPPPTDTAPPMSPTDTPTATPLPVPCVGDCNGDGEVTVNDLIVGVNIALGNQPVTNCPAFDPDDSGTVTINELIRGVTNALNGCS